MGNQIDKGGESKKSSNKITSKNNESMNVNEGRKKLTVKKENLYAEDKLFENYESK